MNYGPLSNFNREWDNPPSCVIGLFDHDYEGIDYGFNKLSSNNFIKFAPVKDSKVHRNKKAAAMLLPIPSEREDYAKNKTLVIEFLFPESIVNKKTPDGRGLLFKYEKEITRVGWKETSKKESTELAWRKISSGKDIFAQQIVATCTQQECDAFKTLFEGIIKLINECVYCHSKP